MSDDKTTIRIPDEDFEEAKRKKEAAGQTWAEYLTDDARGTPDAEAVAEAFTEELGGEVANALDEFHDRIREVEGSVESFDAETVAEELDTDDMEDAVAREVVRNLNADDFMPVKDACKAAIREELTVGEMGR